MLTRDATAPVRCRPTRGPTRAAAGRAGPPLADLGQRCNQSLPIAPASPRYSTTCGCMQDRSTAAAVSSHPLFCLYYSSFQIFSSRRKKEERGPRGPQRVANAEMMKSFLFSKDIPGHYKDSVQTYALILMLMVFHVVSSVIERDDAC